MGYKRAKNKMKKLLLVLPLLLFASMMYAGCYYVEGEIVTYKEHYDENKRFLYQEQEGVQIYKEYIEASDRDSAKRKAMSECQSMCYATDSNPQKITDSNGNVIGYYRLVRKTNITTCYEANYGCD